MENEGLDVLLAIVSFLSTAWGICSLLSPPADDKWRYIPILIGIGGLLPTVAIASGMMPLSTLGIEVLLLALFTLLVYLFYRRRVKIEGIITNRYPDRLTPGGYILRIEKPEGRSASVRVAHHKLLERAAVGRKVSVEVLQPVSMSSAYPTAYRITAID